MRPPAVIGAGCAARIDSGKTPSRIRQSEGRPTLALELESLAQSEDRFRFVHLYVIHSRKPKTGLDLFTRAEQRQPLAAAARDWNQ